MGNRVKTIFGYMHLAQFAGYIVPFAGIIVPIVMWTSFKDNNTKVDVHGKNIINFMITFYLYIGTALVLCLLLIGFALLWGLGVIAILFPIIGAVKAGDNEVYKYPGTIKFLK